MNSHPPIAYGDSVKEFLNRVAQDRDKRVVPNAQCKDSMTTKDCGFAMLFRPNNYRRCLRVLDSTALLKSAIRGGDFSDYTVGSKLCFVRLRGVLVQVGSHSLVGIWEQSGRGRRKEAWFVRRDTVQLLDEWLVAKKLEIVKVIDDVLIELARKYNMKMGDVSWLRHEDWLKEESYISKLPRDLIIYDEVVKKVYADGVEYHGGASKEGVEEVRQYLRNAGLRKFVPEITQVLEKLNERIPPIPAWKYAASVLDSVGGDPGKCAYAWKGLDAYDKEQFLDYWLANYERIGVKR